jgi:hypothetical protein
MAGRHGGRSNNHVYDGGPGSGPRPGERTGRKLGELPPANPKIRSGPTPKSFWSYQAPDTPSVSDLPKGAFKGTQQEFESLSPGMRRELARSFKQKP